MTVHDVRPTKSLMIPLMKNIYILVHQHPHYVSRQREVKLLALIQTSKTNSTVSHYAIILLKIHDYTAERAGGGGDSEGGLDMVWCGTRCGI